MNISRDLLVNGNINTDLFDLLSNLPDSNLFYTEHETRPPLGIYNVSTLRVLDAFKTLANTIHNSNSSYEELTKAHKELLDSLMAYIDDGYHIMKTLFPKNAVTRNIVFADKWLKAIDNQVKKIIEEYQQQLYPFRHRLALMDNKIKHNHARYCHVEVTAAFRKIRGYYIEGVTNNGVIAPNTDIHPMNKEGKYTATSYNWDIKNFLVDFYLLSNLMSRTIYKLANHLGINIPTVKNEIGNNDKLFEVYELVGNIPSFFFPNEYDMNIPQITVKRNEGKLELRKDAYKSFKRNLLKYNSCNVKTVFSGDGVSKSWALPYFK